MKRHLRYIMISICGLRIVKLFNYARSETRLTKTNVASTERTVIFGSVTTSRGCLGRDYWRVGCKLLYAHPPVPSSCINFLGIERIS